MTTDLVATALLARGKLSTRQTFIPLNKISPRVPSASTLSTLANVSPKTSLALSLVGYEPDVAKAMEFVFGNTAICPDAANARLVTFNKDYREICMRSVTLDGDVYDPSGTLSGGSRKQSEHILVNVQKLRRVEEDLAKRKQSLAAVEREWEHARAKMDQFKAAQKQLDLKTHELGLLQERVQESNATRVCPPCSIACVHTH